MKRYQPIKNSLRKHLPHIGLRKLKSILAIFVGFWIWQLIRLIVPGLEVHPIYIYIYGIIEMRDSSEKTKDMGILRIKATFVALAVGLPFLAITDLVKQPFQQEWILTGIELFLLLIGALLCLIAAEKAGCKVFCGLSTAIFVILMVSHADDGRYIYSLLRAAQTIIGVFLAWLINVKLFPYPGTQNAAVNTPPSAK